MSSLHKAQGIEAITVRRTQMADAGKVRYRVYKDAEEFVAVIADSALMAIKVAEIANPYRVVRDLPTAGIAVEAEKIAKAELKERVAFATSPKASKIGFQADLLPPKPEVNERFIPLHLRDLDKKGKTNGFILSHEAMNQLIEAARRPAPPPPSPAAEPPPMQHTQPAIEPEPVAPVPPSAPEPPPPAASPTPAAGDTNVLSPQEVEKLLNE